MTCWVSISSASSDVGKMCQNSVLVHATLTSDLQNCHTHFVIVRRVIMNSQQQRRSDFIIAGQTSVRVTVYYQTCIIIITWSYLITLNEEVDDCMLKILSFNLSIKLFRVTRHKIVNITVFYKWYKCFMWATLSFSYSSFNQAWWLSISKMRTEFLFASFRLFVCMTFTRNVFCLVYVNVGLWYCQAFLTRALVYRNKLLTFLFIMQPSNDVGLNWPLWRPQSLLLRSRLVVS